MKLNRLALAGALGISFLVGGISVAHAEPEIEPFACVLVTGTPGGSGGNVGANVGRSGCTNYATWQGWVKHDRTLRPDDTHAYGAGTGNSVYYISGPCGNRGSYYSEVQSSTGSKQQSARVTRC